MLNCNQGTNTDVVRGLQNLAVVCGLAIVNVVGSHSRNMLQSRCPTCRKSEHGPQGKFKIPARIRSQKLQGACQFLRVPCALTERRRYYSCVCVCVCVCVCLARVSLVVRGRVEE